MLGKQTRSAMSAQQKLARKTRLHTISVRVALPDGPASRLAGKIRESVSRTLSQEGADDTSVTIVPDASPDANASPGEKTQATRPAGCGAWWNF